MSWLLLDRDDTILDDPGYLKDPNHIKFLSGSISGLKRFFEAGWPLVVITNQSGIGRGYFGEAELALVHDKFRTLLEAEGIQIAGIYHCPHAPDEGCQCRKPEIGMAVQASEELGLSLEESIMVGDKPSDLKMGRAIGAKFVAQIVAKREACELADGHFETIDSLADKLLG